MAGSYNPTIEQGATFRRNLLVRANGVAFPADGWDGWVGRSQLRARLRDAEPTAVFHVTLSPVTPGLIELLLSAEETAALPARDLLYDLEIENTASGEVIRLLEGTATVSPEVTR